MSYTSEIVDGINSKQQSSIEMCYCDCNKQSVGYQAIFSANTCLAKNSAAIYL